MTTTNMYWLVMLDNIRGAMAGMIFLAVLAMIVMICLIDSGSDRLIKIAVKAMAGALAVLIMGVTALTFLPSTKQMAAIVVIPKIANSEGLNKLGENIIDLANEWMEELKPVKKEVK